MPNSVIILLILIVGNDGLGHFPKSALLNCDISNQTIEGVLKVYEDHEPLVKMSGKGRARKTEIDSMKADIDFYLDYNAPDSDKTKWIKCVTKSPGYFEYYYSHM